MQNFKNEFLGCWANETVGFLHRHPDMEARRNVPDGHVIVDKEDWEKVRNSQENAEQNSNSADATDNNERVSFYCHKCGAEISVVAQDLPKTQISTC